MLRWLMIVVLTLGCAWGTSKPVKVVADSLSCTKSISISATVNQTIVFGTPGTTIYICGLFGTERGTNPTVQFVTGTGSVCATSKVNLTGVINPVGGQPIMITSSSAPALIASPASDVCIILGGTSPDFEGSVVYTQL